MQAKLKPYKIQDMVFSGLRSKISYQDPKSITDVFTLKSELCSLNTCNPQIQSKVSSIVESIIAPPIHYDGHNNEKNKRDAQGFVIWKNNTIYVTFRGTSDACDLLDVLDIRPKKLMNDIYVHTGFAQQFMSLESKLTVDIKDIIASHPIERIVFAGHSMGGAIAIIAAAYYGNLFATTHITCHTFGCPSVGNDAFVKWYAHNVDESIRLEIEEDLIPLISINDFKHIPGGVRLKRGGQVESDYHVRYMSYGDIARALIDNGNVMDFFDHHTCDQHINRLLSLDTVRKPL